MAVSLLFTPALFTTNLIILRSGKILEAAVSLALLYVFLRIQLENCKFKVQGLILTIFLLFIGMTSGEQAVATAAFLFVLSLLISILKKKIQPSAFLFGCLCLLYLFWHMAIGPVVFQHFTSQPITPHPHQYTQVFYNFFLGTIPGLVLFWENLKGFFTLAPAIILSLFYCAWLIYGNSRKRFIIGIIMLTPLSLADSIVCSHKFIWYLESLHEHMYSIAIISITACLLYFALLASRFSGNRFFKMSLIVFLCLLCSWHLTRTSDYVEWLYSEKGFMKPIPFSSIHSEFRNAWSGVNTDNIIFMVPKNSQDWPNTNGAITDIIHKMKH